ncbi:short chain dehydrogenase [Neobacillus piezotolerans]|uniref:Short chain dehydrogenase n=1 Tax=Neobacillus piezotolerans TaxID=2259171 RepID=A0A3D8GX20_9BACI|nr:SDR family oxidoreductase [Neobacillus piezotolerans]RDU38983.1 short chain dehydrogenase [Neobacillus piezotolerans]
MRKFALITGASGGIGQAIAAELAARGYNLYLHYNSNKEAAERLVESLSVHGGEYSPIMADFSRQGGYKELLPSLFGVDAVVHCGGTAAYGLFQDLDDEEAASLFNIHVLNPMLLTKALIPELLKRKTGSIVFIASIWGQTGAACEAAYSAAKGAQISFVKALGKELAPSGIRVNAIAPGAVETQMIAGFSSEELEELANEIPMGRLGRPKEIANAAAFLLSEQASYITGHILSVNGGWYT